MELKMRHLLPVLALCGCVNDEDDGKASVYSVIMVDAAVVTKRDASVDAGAGEAQLELSCRKTVVSEHTLPGFSVQVRGTDGLIAPAGTYVAISPSTGTIVSNQPGGGVTDVRGIVEFAYVAPHFDFPMPITVEAALRDADGKPAASARCSFQVVTDGLEFVTPASGALIGWNVQAPITLAVAAEDVGTKCAQGGGVRIKASGTALGGFALSPTDPPVDELCFETPGGGALRQFYVRGGDRGGTFRFEASAGDYSAELALQMVGAPAAVMLKGDTSDINLNSAANLAITVTDDVGQGVGNVRLALAVTRCAGTSCSPEEMITPTELTTRNDGTASAAYFAGDQPGAAQITVSVVDRPGVSGTMVLRVH